MRTLSTPEYGYHLFKSYLSQQSSRRSFLRQTLVHPIWMLLTSISPETMGWGDVFGHQVCCKNSLHLCQFFPIPDFSYPKQDPCISYFDTTDLIWPETMGWRGFFGDPVCLSLYYSLVVPDFPTQRKDYTCHMSTF